MTLAQFFYKCAGSWLVEYKFQYFILNIWLWLGLVASIFGMIFWLITLNKVPLSKAYPWTAIIYIFTPLLGLIFWNEQLDFNYLMGLFFILLGIFICTKSVAA
jgi:drug/metabolite transporter (DMT)-like permease